MIFLERPGTDPFVNIAAEEYLLKNCNDDYCMIWQNEPSVIIGKHQNALKEVNFNVLRQNNIPFIRRISGGGTVYHDLNNINYSLITTGERTDRLIDFKKYLHPLIEFLNSLEVPAVFEGKNNLMVQGQKISGNSAHVFKNRVLHHGTLLFNTDLKLLHKTITPPYKNIEDKAIQSIRKKVVNIKALLTSKMPIEVFKVLLKEHVVKYYNIKEIKSIRKSDQKAISELADTKYKQWEWNFGYSPRYIFKNENMGLKVKFQVKNGIIVESEFLPINNEHRQLAKTITGLPHRADVLKNNLNDFFKDQQKVMLYEGLLDI